MRPVSNKPIPNPDQINDILPFYSTVMCTSFRRELALLIPSAAKQLNGRVYCQCIKCLLKRAHTKSHKFCY